MPRQAAVLEEHPAGPLGSIQSRTALGRALGGEFSAEIVRMMGEQGISQRRLAAAIGRPRSTVACWLTGARREPGFADFYRLARALGVSPAALWEAMTRGFR